MKAKRILVFVLVSLLLVTATACAPSSAPVAGTEQPQAAETTVAKDTVTVAINMVVKTLDPHDGSSLVQNQVSRQMYEGLYFLNDFTKEYEPRLATEHSVSDDGLVYTFKLREGVKFHNGDEMKASDVVFSFERAKTNATLNTFTKMIEKVEADGDYSVKITLNKAYAPFLHHSTNVAIVSQKVAEEAGDTLGTTDVDAGTGPYMMKSYKPDTLIEMEAFADYYRGKAPIAHARIKPLVDSSTGLIALENKEIDFYSIPLANWKEITESGKYETLVLPSNHVTFMLINPTRGNLGNPDLRKAISYAINREAVVAAAYEGLAKPAFHMLNPDYVFGAVPNNEGVIYEFDQGKAKEYLVKAGYPDGVDIGTITTLAGTYFDKATQVIQSNLADVGINAKVASMEQAAMISSMLKGEYEMVVSGYACQMDYDFFATLSYTEGNSASLAKYTGSDVDHKAIDAMFDKGASEQDPEARKLIYSELDGMLMDTATWVPLFWRSHTFAWDKGLEAKSFANYYYLYDWKWK